MQKVLKMNNVKNMFLRMGRNIEREGKNGIERTEFLPVTSSARYIYIRYKQ